MKQGSITLTIHVAWWLRWYIRGVALTCMLTGADPDMDKVGRMIESALSFQPTPTKGPTMKHRIRNAIALAAVIAVTAVATYAAYASCCRPTYSWIPGLF
jgi:hypothetical protein